MTGRDGCSFCAKACSLLDERGLRYEEVPATPRRLRASSGRTATPQIFIDGKHIGGAEDHALYLGE